MTPERAREYVGCLIWIAAHTGPPLCVRVIRVASDGRTARVSGLSGLRLWVRVEILFTGYWDALNAGGAWVAEMWDYDLLDDWMDTGAQD